MCTGYFADLSGNSADLPLSGPKTLQEVQLPVINNQNCDSMYRPGGKPDTPLIQDDMLCAGYQQGKKDACQGDSGGPLVYNVRGVWLQVGITSWGYGCAEPNNPGVYTRVQYYQSWLQNHIPSLQFSDGGTGAYPSSTAGTTRSNLIASSMTASSMTASSMTTSSMIASSMIASSMTAYSMTKSSMTASSMTGSVRSSKSSPVSEHATTPPTPDVHSLGSGGPNHHIWSTSKVLVTLLGLAILS